jgi:hypothetical protein
VDRRLFHKIATIGGALVVIGGAVLFLREPDPGTKDEGPTIPPPQTQVQRYADGSVVVPEPGERPETPPELDIQAGDHRLVARWTAPPGDVVGYEVRWGIGQSEQTRLVATPVIQLDGLRNDAEHRIAVRAVDSFGQRSKPVTRGGIPTANVHDATAYSLVDRFDGPVVPDPARWRLVGIGNCTKASRGDGEESRRLVVTGQCGFSDEAVALRSRTPLKLRDQPGELGRLTVLTDSPGPSGELLLDLVPGPADLIGRPPRPLRADQPGLAAVDDSLPPGAIRVRISGRIPGPTTSVDVLVGPGTPLTGQQAKVNPLPAPEPGVSVRWDVVLRSDGVQVERDGAVVGGGNVVPTFTEATALIGFAGSEGLRASIDLIGLSGAPTEPPPLFPAPRVDFDRVVNAPGSRLQTTGIGQEISGATGGQLRITLAPQHDLGQDDQFTVDIGGKEIPARRAVPSQAGMAGVRLPIVADIPADALVASENGQFISVAVRGSSIDRNLPTQVLTAELELTGQAPGIAPVPDAERPLPRPNPALGTPMATLHDAAGSPVPTPQDVPRGRLVLDVQVDSAKAQRIVGGLAGLAGVELALDGKPLAGIPTVTDGPGVGGHWRIGLNTTGLATGSHTLQMTAIGVDPSTPPVVGYAQFVIS